MTAMRVKKAAPVVVVGGSNVHIQGFLDAYQAKQDIELIGTPMCLLHRLAVSTPKLAVFLPGYAKESLEAALGCLVWCHVYEEYKIEGKYPERYGLTWYYAAPDIKQTVLPFCTLKTFAREVRSLATFA